MFSWKQSFENFSAENKATVPKFIAPGLSYLTMMGSRAYGVEKPDSDYDIYGFTVPPKEIVFPHLTGHIPNFGTPPVSFNQWQGTGPVIRPKGDTIEADFSIYSIIQYFNLVSQNNPNMLDSLFTPDHCILICNEIGKRVREKRDVFINKRCYYTYGGYAYSQLNKVRNKNPIGKRAAEVAEAGFDLKFSYHLVRLVDECHQLLETGTMSLDLNKEKLKAIRAGQWTLVEVEEYFAKKQSILDALYAKSTIPHSPDEQQIKTLLLECLEMAYGSIDSLLKIDDSSAADKLRRIQTILDE